MHRIGARCRVAILLATSAVDLLAQVSRPAAPPDIVAKLQSARVFFESVWRKAFAASGRTFVPPKYAEFVSSSGPCGGGGPAYYCIPQNTIYYNRAELLKIQNAAAARLHTDGDYAALIVLAHELGHAVDHQLGLGNRQPFSERRENNADCMAGAATREAAEAKLLDKGDVEEALFAMSLAGQDGIRTIIDPNTHGSPAQRVLSFRVGYQHGWRGCDLSELGMRPGPR